MIARWLGLFLFAALMLATTTAQRSSVFVDGQIYYVDADCYARMSRVEQVLAHPFQRITHHDFENFPTGANVHTTAPLDWLIALLAMLFSIFSSHALDLAGAWISPLLGLGTIAILWTWSTRERLPYRHAMMVLFATSPIVVQAFRLGRPDHQSLLLLLLAAALATEWNLWKKTHRPSAIVSGCAWGLALWTSLYEPLVFLVLVVTLRAALLRRKAFSPVWGIAYATMLAVFALGVIVDGWRVSGPSPEVEQYFFNWSRSIAELAHLPPLSPQFVGWLGWFAPALPILLAWRFWKAREPHFIAMAILTIVTYALTCWQLRWGCYLALVFTIALPFALPAVPSLLAAGILVVLGVLFPLQAFCFIIVLALYLTIALIVTSFRTSAWVLLLQVAVGTLFMVSLFPVGRQWGALLNPSEGESERLAEQRTDYQLLHEVGMALISTDRTGILAPWWLSPPLAYWSGQPCVAGSSHESLSGTVATAQFYMATDPEAARQILLDRKVSYVVAYEPSRVLSTSSLLLNEPPPDHSFGQILYDTPDLAPSWLEMVYSNAYFKVYEVKPNGI